MLPTFRLTKKMKTLLARCGILFGLFLFFTLLIKIVDVKPIGPYDSKVGFAGINGAVFNLLKGDTVDYNPLWYKLTKYVGYLSLLVAAGFGCLSVLDAVQRRSIWKLNYRLLSLCAFYSLVVFSYLLFEVVVVNYRPVLMDAKEGLEASYPSSHTMLALCIMGSFLKQRRYWLKDQLLCMVASVAAYAVMAVMVLGRMLANVHWFTDILGGVLLSCFLLSVYDVIYEYLRPKKKRRKKAPAAQEEAAESASATRGSSYLTGKPDDTAFTIALTLPDGFTK